MTGSTSRAELDRRFLDGWTRAGMYAAVFGVLLVVMGLATRTTADPVEVQIVALHNATAETGSAGDCPSGPEPSWHFVLAPNNGTFRFVRIVLDLDGTIVTFDDGDWIRNGGQRDNVFVPVPTGYSLSDLRRSGSFAEVTPGGDVRFVLSHVCSGHSATTTTVPKTTTSMPGTTTTVPGTSTTVPGTTTTTSVPHKTTTTTVADTTTTVADTTTTTVADTTTTTVADTTTTTVADTTTTTVADTTTTTVADTTTTTVADTTTTTVADTTTTVPDTTTTVADTTTTTVPDTTTTTVEQRPPPTTTTTTTTTVQASTTTAPASVATTTTTKPSTTTTTVPKTIVISGSGSSRTLIMLGVLMILVGTSLVLGSYARRVGDGVAG
jgi:hypothetical protein